MRPNFFLIGGPRSGTTSLFKYLNGHHRVFMCRPKEPNFFCPDLKGLSRVSDQTGYARLFHAVTAEHLAVGEASVWYLSSRVAPEQVREFNPAARIIVMLRNPIDLVRSLHEKLRVVGWEDEPDLSRAIELESRRRSGDALPPNCPTPGVVEYARVARHGDNLERWLEHFPRERVCPIVFDDFALRPGESWSNVLEFLELPPDTRREFPRHNSGRAPRKGLIAATLRAPPRPLRAASRAVRRLMRAIGLNDGLLTRGFSRVGSKNEHRGSRPPLDEDLQRHLCDVFAADVAKLSDLLERDLTGWLEPDASHPNQPASGLAR